MSWWKGPVVGAATGLLVAPAAMADMHSSGDWSPRTAVTPDPTKVVVPDGYEVGILVAGLDTPAAGAVDGDGNIWVTISGSLLGGPEPIDEPHVKVFDPDGNLIREIGRGVFTSVMNEIGYCAENGIMYIPEYGEKIWEIDGVDGELQLIVQDLFFGDHRNGGITCKDGYLYFALGFPTNTGFADPDNHGWTDIPNDPYWVIHDTEGFGTTPHDPPCRDIVHTGLNVRSSDGRLTGGTRENPVNPLLFNSTAGAVRITLLLLYMWGLSFLPDVRRLFQYHGAEHKSIFAHESGAGLSTDSVDRQARFHPRCGTSFILIVALTCILFFSVMDALVLHGIGYAYPNFFVRFLAHLPFVPVVAGLSFELLKLSARHQDSAWISPLVAPGLWLQRITTKNPDAAQIEVAIASSKAALRN
jgi:hypothetical protein